ncbi:MAG TPA: hypothetical protein VGC09_16080 [Rhodopila sp.]
MWTNEDIFERTSLFGPPLLVAASVFLLNLLPGGLLAFLTAWVVLSVPVGLLVGHCILSEKKD